MLSTINRILGRLKRDRSGNAVLLVALGTPVLIGGSGLAVDAAQYYMWKRDLQFAADQAALAGAWARTNTTNQDTYSTRATQEYNSNVQNTGSFDTAPTVSLVYYDQSTRTVSTSGTSNAVKVVASASKALPFTNIITGRPVTVSVQSVAYYTVAGASVTTTTTLNTITSCMIALNPTAAGAFIIGGNATGSVGCGGAALSNDPSAAIRENGNPSATFGQLVATGGIEYSLLNNVGGDPTRLRSNTVGLVDPLGSLTTPTGSGVSQTYSCPTATSGSAAVYSYSATQLLRTKVTYAYSKGSTSSNAVPITYTSGTGYLANSDDNPGVTSTITRSTSAYTASGPTQAGPTAGTPVNITGSGQNRIWRTATTTTWTTISNPQTTLVSAAVPANDGIARPNPGTYTNISIACQTIFQPGIYVINGTIDFSQNQTVSGTDVLFVMTQANRIDNINSNTNIALSGITSSTLTGTYGYSAATASKLAGMIFFDKLSTNVLKFNGNSSTNLNGVIYMPQRTLWFNGTSAVSGKCMMLVADKLQLDGTTNLSSFCQPSNSNSMEVRPQTTTTTTIPGTAASVKLVS